MELPLLLMLTRIMFEFLYLPFVARALIAGIIIALVFGYVGVFASLRKMAFFGSGIAHASLAGVAAGLLLGWYPLYVAVAAGVLFALLIYVIETRGGISSDTIIGMIFSGGMALGIVLMSMEAGYQPELMSFLFGNILAITETDLWVIGIASAFVLGFFMWKQKELTLLSLDAELAQVSGVPVARLTLIMYVLLALVVVLGIKVAGIILVSALLTVPVAAARMVTGTFAGLLFGAMLISLIAMVAGIVASYMLNLPMGPSVVLVNILFFAVLFVLRSTGMIGR